MNKSKKEEDNHWFWDETYVFQYKNNPSDSPDFVKYFNLYRMNDRLEEARKDIEFKEVNLYVCSSNLMDDAYCNRTYYLTYLLNEYFMGVFEQWQFRTGFMGSHRYNRVILKKSVYAEIMNFINDNELLHIKDLIIELIAISQDTYIDDVLHWENNGFEQSINNIDKEIEKLNILFDSVSERSYMRDRNTIPNLIGITAKFDKSVGQKNPNKSITLTDSWIIRDFVKYYMKYFEENLPFKGDWKKSLKHYGENIYQIASEKLNFNYRLSASIYNMLTKEKIIDGDKAKGKILYFITKIFDFALIPFNTKDKEVELNKAQKIRHVGNYIDRHLKDLKPLIKQVTLPPDKNRLLKYFDDEFINHSTDEKSAETLVFVHFICTRFNILNQKETITDFAHILQSFSSKTFFSKHQLLTEIPPKSPPCDDYAALRTLIEGIKVNKSITQIRFKIEGSEKEFSLNERLPLYVIERALNNHLKNYKEDFENDIIKVKTVTSSTPRQNNTVYAKRLNLPDERFIVRFVKSMYEYFTNEVKLKDCPEYKLPKTYYIIIGLMIQHTWYFSQIRDSEDCLIEKVEHWHKLSHPI